MNRSFIMASRNFRLFLFLSNLPSQGPVFIRCVSRMSSSPRRIARFVNPYQNRVPSKLRWISKASIPFARPARAFRLLLVINHESCGVVAVVVAHPCVYQRRRVGSVSRSQGGFFWSRRDSGTGATSAARRGASVDGGKISTLQIKRTTSVVRDFFKP